MVESNLDTLAFDPRTNAPVAIEFRDRAVLELVSQGVSALRALSTQAQVAKYLVKRAGFVPERIAWGKMRAMFLAREAVAPLKGPLRFLDGGVELWGVPAPRRRLPRPRPRGHVPSLR